MELNLKLLKEKSPDLLYVDARFDVPEQGSFMITPSKDLVILDNFVLRYGSITRRMIGYEISHKAKKPHYHIRYEIERNEKRVPATFGSAFTYYYRALPGMPALTKGGHMVKRLDKPDNFDAFFQYPLKDQEEFDDILMDLIIGFSHEYIVMLWTKAKENRRIALQRFEKEEQKKNNEILEYGKLTDYLGTNFHEHIIKQNVPCSNEHGFIWGNYFNLRRELGILILDYYKLNHDSKMPTKNKLISTIHRYLCSNNYLTTSELIEIYMEK